MLRELVDRKYWCIARPRDPRRSCGRARGPTERPSNSLVARALTSGRLAELRKRFPEAERPRRRWTQPAADVSGDQPFERLDA